MAILTSVAPELPVAGMAQALDDYQKVLGFDVTMTMPDGEYAIVERDDVAIHLFESAPGARTPGSVHIFTTGLDTLLAEFQARGAQVTQAIVRQPWGNRDFRIADSSGNVLKFTEPLEPEVREEWSQETSSQPL